MDNQQNLTEQADAIKELLDSTQQNIAVRTLHSDSQDNDWQCSEDGIQFLNATAYLQGFWDTLEQEENIIRRANFSDDD